MSKILVVLLSVALASLAGMALWPGAARSGPTSGPSWPQPIPPEPAGAKLWGPYGKPNPPPAPSDNGLEIIQLGCNSMVDGTAPNNGCPPGQDSQSLQLSVTVSGFGIEGVVMSAMRNSPNGCVPSGTSSITKDLCANTASALKTSGCQITFESSDSSDRTPGFIADAGLTLLCRGDRSFLVATADNALSVGFGVTPPK